MVTEENSTATKPVYRYAVFPGEEVFDLKKIEEAKPAVYRIAMRKIGDAIAHRSLKVG